MKKRLDYIDIAKGIAIITVIVTHLIPNDYFKNIINMINIPVFYMSYGMVLKSETISKTIQKRFYGIYLPYVLWGLIFSGLSFRRCALLLYGTNQSLISAGSNGMLWYLPIMFISSVLVSIIFKAIKNKENLLVRCVVIIISLLLAHILHETCTYKTYGVPFALDGVFFGTAFILAGNTASKYFDNLYAKLKKNTIRVFVGILLLSVSCLCIVLKENPNIGYLQVATMNVGSIPLFFAIAIVTVLGVFILSREIEKISFMRKILVWLGQNTMVIFIMHRTIVYPLKEISLEIGYIVLIPIATVVLLYSSFCAAVINKICPSLSGKKN